MRSDDEVYIFVSLVTAVLYACVLHVGLLVLFAVEGLAVMLVINAVALALFGLCAFLVLKKQRIKPVGFMVSIGIMVYAALASTLCGTGTYNVFYFVLVTTIQFVVPYAPKPQRGVVTLVMLCAVFTLVVRGFFYPPVYPLTRIGLALAIYNVVLGLAGLACELTIVTTTKKVIAGRTAYQLGEMTDRANSDSLTGLYNRRYAHMFFDNLKRGRTGEKWSVAMLDVDDFKQLNDHYGHLAGDAVLSGIAEIMREKLRSSDLIFRWGGEEFMIILKGAALVDADRVLDSMRQTIQETTFDAAGNNLNVTVTIGVAKLDPHVVEECVNRSDELMYEGKRRGKNVVICEE